MHTEKEQKADLKK